MWVIFSLLTAASVIPLAPALSGSSWHSLHHLYLGVSEPIQALPLFTQLGYVDDQLITYYNDSTRRVQPRVPWMEKAEDAQFWEWETHFAKDAEFFFQLALPTLQDRYNQSGGLHTWQCLVGCEMSKDGKQTGRYMQCGYDGRDFISLDKETFTWTAADDMAQLTKKLWEGEWNVAQDWRPYLEEKCIERLKNYLHYGEETLLRREPPTVKVTHKVGHDGWENHTCQAYGFYPKQINITWRKDGKVWEQNTSRGGVSPSLDGTYNSWVHIEIDSKDRDHYRCHVEHIGLLKPLDLALEDPALWPVEVTQAVIMMIVAVVLQLAVSFLHIASVPMQFLVVPFLVVFVLHLVLLFLSAFQIFPLAAIVEPVWGLMIAIPLLSEIGSYIIRGLRRIFNM
ncbi:major histocompatibility complex class I-related gene protein-like isoform X2 [Hemicordylus capensis]|uniref:major histocompatibility complex class I-related gene protein-like isoform X2 n=1 Tax=Hemicordylus capensis TaxID=884348 RepID=UPI00230235DC|nr:major histocompatibility complex class I-related gene protein-like isoform X2 [Hemicordylus capensis]